MAALAWTYLAAFAYAPWWAAAVLVVVYLVFVFWALERTVGSRVDPVRATFVPFWGLYTIVAVTGLGVLTLGW